MYPNNVRRREAIFKEMKAKHPAHVVSPSFLRQDIATKSNKSNYEFTFLQENGQASLPEKLLSRTDLFEVTHMGLYLLMEKTAKPGSGILQTYPNSTVFTDSTVEDLETFWNGHMSVQVNNVIVVEDFPTRKFRYVPETLKSAGNINSSYPMDAGMVELPIRIRMDGANKNNFRVETPSYDGIALVTTTAGSAIKLVMVLEGFLIESAARGSWRE